MKAIMKYPGSKWSIADSMLIGNQKEISAKI